MTGYGRVEASEQGRNIAVEVKSVNHRFLELSLRIPPPLFPLELELRKKISENFKRGRIEVFIRVENGNGNTDGTNINMENVRNYFCALRKIKEEFGLLDDVSLQMLTGCRDIFSAPAETQYPPELLNRILSTLDEAVLLMTRMRCDEGLALYQDMKGRIKTICDVLAELQGRSPQVVVEYQKRLTERIRELTSGCDLDESRLVQEVALMADRSDITEEIVRLHSHLNQFTELLESDEAMGKKIDFLLQEMNREVNTIGSKSNDMEIARYVIELKSEFSKLREQAQNIE